MTSTLAAFALRVADFYFLATVFLLGTAAVMVVRRQPARRLAAASAGLAGLVLLAALAVLPFWPRVTVGRLCAAVPSSAETGTAVAGPAEPLADPAADEAEAWLLDAGPRERKAAGFPAISAMPPEDATGPGLGMELSDRVLAWLAGLFLAGAGGLAIWLLRGAVQAARLTARSWPAPPWLQAEFDRLAGTAGPTARLRLSRDISSAVALGVWRPMILLPAILVEEAGRTQWRAVLAHEWAHIRHGDLRRLAVSRWLFVLLFAHPVYWWLRRAFRQDQELLADAVAVAGSGLSAGDYAEVLVGWARRSTARVSLAAAALGIWERPSQLTRRIAMLLDERFHVEAGTTRRWRHGVLAVAAVAAVGLSLLTLWGERPAVAAGEPEPSSQPAPTALAKLRSPAQRAVQLKKDGGNAATEKAVAAALEWIVRHQSPDGSWGLGDYRKQCQEPACADLDRVHQADPQAAATAMGLLPLLAAGHSHQAPGRYQTAVKKGLQWLVQHQKPDGDLSAGSAGGPRMYCHGLAALALCDAYALTGDQELAGAAQRAVVFIEAAQDPQGGGWRYQPRQSGDTSVFGWQVAALRAAQMGRLKVQPATLEGARKYLRSAAVGERGNRFGYTPGGGATPSMTAVGLSGAQFLVHDGDPAALRGGYEVLLQALPAARSNVYLLYYATQALHQASGKEWQTWNEPVRDVLVQAQQPGPGCAAGSWDPGADTWGRSGGRLMITSFACLCLEVYYRYPPVASGLVANPPAIERSPQARASRETGPEPVAQGKHGGRFSYVPTSGPSPTMTAVGLLARQCLRAKPDDPAVREGVQVLMTSPPDAEQGRAS